MMTTSKFRSTAYNYINAVERFGGSPKVIEALPPATIYKLAAKATPDTLRDAVVGEINAGVAISADDVERRIAEAKNPGAKKKKEDAAQNLRQVTEKSKVSARKLVELLRDNLPDDIFEEFSDGAKGLYFCSDLIEVLREDYVLF